MVRFTLASPSQLYCDNTVTSPSSGAHLRSEVLRAPSLWSVSQLFQNPVFWGTPFRIIVLGDAAVGKSSLLRCFADRPSGGPGGVATPGPTIGVEFYSRTILMSPTVKAKLQLGYGWPGAVQWGRCKSWTSPIGHLLSMSLRYHEAAGDRLPVFVLVGHKCDLVAEGAVSAEEAGHLATTLSMAFVKTSACSNVSMELAFQTLAGSVQQVLGILAPHQECDGIKLIPSQSRRQPPAGREPQKHCQC
ncbi:ras-related protein Rab-42-like [Cyanistes caeruleus]|uniref:ras-related protein Rab-42-like n=1 Tax=Cyanistes caeruleus TaxID=156563 RepID=UPI000CDA7AFF|nr:ras-related protein Rab-42-like [Cyanistes caeruleus]